MRTKSILLGAAILAAGVASSMAANVYSVNVVGYVNLNVQSNKFYLLANPLDDGKGNVITNILPLNDSFDNGNQESLIYAFKNGGIQPVETYFAGFGWAPGTNTFPPGTGFYLLPVTNATITFAGNVVTNSSITLNGGFSLVGSQFPASLDITTLGLTGTNDVGPNPDLLYRYTPGVGLNDISTFFSGYGWAESVNGNPVGGTGGPPSGPTLNIGEGFFYQVSAGNTSFQWKQAFSVN